MESPLPVKFPLPDPQDSFSLKPGAISVHITESKANEMEKSASLSAAIAGARAAATQFSKKIHNTQTINNIDNKNITKTDQLERKTSEEGETVTSERSQGYDKQGLGSISKEPRTRADYRGLSTIHNGPNQHLGTSSKVFSRLFPLYTIII